MSSGKHHGIADRFSGIYFLMARRAYGFLFLSFVTAFLLSYWLTPTKPYATLHVYADGDALLFSPDSTRLLTMAPGVSLAESTQMWSWSLLGPLQMWDVASGHEVLKVAVGWHATHRVRFSPDKRRFAAQDDQHGLKIWSTATGQEIGTLGTKENGSEGSTNFAFSPDGRFLIFQDYSKSREKDHITFWDIESKKKQATIEGEIDTLLFAPDGTSFSTYRRKGLEVTAVLLWKL